MERKTKIAIFVGAILAVGTGIFFYMKSNLSKLIDMTYRFQNFKLNKTTITDVQASAEVVLTNPSDLSFTITGYDVNVEFQGYNVANIKRSDANIPISSNQSVTIPFDVQFDPRKVGANLYPLFLDVFINKTKADKFKVHYTGTISVRYGAIGFKNIPIDYSYEF